MEKKRRWVAGVDVGSRHTKAVILNQDQLAGFAVVRTQVDACRSARHALGQASAAARVGEEPLAAVVGTGYGRVSLDFVDKTVTELTCHARGCHHVDPTIRTVIDVGGQDSKAILLDGQGNMVDFVMNDKCAAGTGKFLEMAAETLGMTVDEMSAVDSEVADAIAINNMCVVFAESEIVSLMAKGRAPKAIVAGIHQSFAKRIGNLAKRLGGRLPITFAGGVAKNRSLAQALSGYLDAPFCRLPIDPQITGALGAAVIAGDLVASREEVS